jgi:membrane-anchored protein YejM (alkaline phosphatase superfamily)
MGRALSAQVSTRRRLLRWAGWFAVVHAGLLALVGLRYLWYYVTFSPSVAWGYALLAYVGHLSMLASLPFVLIVMPVALIVPWARLVVPLGVLLASVEFGLLLLDSLVFAEHRYHLDVLTATLLAPHTWAFAGVYFVMALAIEGVLASWVWKRCARPPTRRIGRYVAIALVGALVSGHLIHAWAEARYEVPVTSFSRYLPLFFPLRGSRLQARLGLVDRARAREHMVVAASGRPPAGTLRYPLHPLHCEPHARMPSVLLVVVDAMRADALTPEAAPRMSAFAEGAVRFEQHYSGGNASRAGLFSLFYGLPATYWDAFADVARPPLLMDLLRRYDYQLGVFTSSTVYGGVGLDRTVLAGVPNLRLKTTSLLPGSSGRDRTLTDDWHRWLDRRDPARPFFGLLYYNAVVAIEPPDGYPVVFSAPPDASARQRLYARYLGAVHFVDSLVGQVLDDLERRKLLDDLIVIITSDHGMEFDENGLGFTGHGTAYSKYQMHTPLVWRWPGRAPGRVTRRTSHNDVAPTLLTELFGCTNPPADYSSGYGLFVDRQWEWLVATGYSSDLALLEADRVTIVYPAGYEIRDRDYRLLAHPRLSREALMGAQKEMGRFYR